MKKIKINGLRPRHFSKLLAASLAVLLTIGILFWWQAGQKVEDKIVEGVRQQNSVIARAGALSIADFFREQKRELLLLSQIEAVQAGEEEKGREALGLLADHLEDSETSFVGIARLNREGEVIWSTDSFGLQEEEGMFLTNRDYFIWARQQEEQAVYISSPLIGRGGRAEGEWGVVMATPVFYRDRFNGTLIIFYLLEELAEKYVLSLTFSPTTEVILANEEGFVLASTMVGMTGSNLTEHVRLRNQDWVQTKKLASSGKEGSLLLDFAFQDQTRKVLAVFAPVFIEEKSWALMVVQPYEEVASQFHSLDRARTAVILVVFFGVLVLSSLFILGIRVTQKRAFVNGFRNGLDGHKKT
jgi:hypothetical protein